MVGEKDKGKGKLKEMEEEDKAAKGKKAEKRKKKSGLMSGEGSKKKVRSKKEIQKEEKSSKEKKPAREKKGQKVVPGWGLTRGVHPPRFNPFLISCMKINTPSSASLATRRLALWVISPPTATWRRPPEGCSTSTSTTAGSSTCSRSWPGWTFHRIRTFLSLFRITLCEKRFGYQLPPYFYPPAPLGENINLSLFLFAWGPNQVEAKP